MRLKLLPLLTLLFACAFPVIAQTTSLNIGPAGYTCGAMSIPVYCYGIPTLNTDADGNVISNGSVWVDAQKIWSNTLRNYTVGGFVLVNGQEHAITGSAPWTDLSITGGTITYNFTGGSITLVYTTYYSRGGGGRGGGGAGYRWIVGPQSTLALQ